MPARKAAKKTSAKKAAKKKTGQAAGASSKVKLDFPLDAKTIAAIHRCIAKGTLRVTVNKVDLSAGRLRGPWLYD